MTGYVYLLANPGMPRLYKIGMTRGDPQERARQLSAPSGLPGDFEVLVAALVPHAGRFERELHSHYRMNRPNDRREFFVFSSRNELEEVCERIATGLGVMKCVRHEEFDFWAGWATAAA